jgi:TRAP-type C4-dicarboxylate transport system permease small subunit
VQQEPRANTPPPLPLPPSRVRFGLELVAAALLLLLLILLLTAMALRLLGRAEPWLFELTRVLFVFLTGLAAVVAYARGQNLRVPGPWTEGSVSYEAVHFALVVLLTVLAARYLYVQGFAIDATSLLGLPEVAPYLPVLLFGGGVAIVYFHRLRRALRRSRATGGAT